VLTWGAFQFLGNGEPQAVKIMTKNSRP
jgi:hypothetical protein